MFCPKCGAKLPDNTRYCVQCGTELDAAPAQPIPKVPPLADPAKRPRKKIAIVVTALVLVLALLAGGLAFWGTRKSGRTNDSYYLQDVALTFDTEEFFHAVYSPDGNLFSLSVTQNKNEGTFTPEYDTKGRVRTLSWSKGSSYTFTYEQGTVVGLDSACYIGTDPNDPTLSFCYGMDYTLRMIRSGASSPYESRRIIFDSAGRLKSIVYDGNVLNLVYDQNDHLTSLYASRGNLLFGTVGNSILEPFILLETFSRFPDLIGFLMLLYEDGGLQPFLNEINLDLHYDDNGRLSGGTLTCGESLIQLAKDKDSPERTDFQLLLSGITMEEESSFTLINEYQENVWRASRIVCTNASGEEQTLSKRTFDAQGYLTEIQCYDGSSNLILKKTWSLA